jgi:sec-independent protein translocase protein TatA
MFRSRVQEQLITKEKQMFGFGPMELTIILVIILIIFGAGRLPEIGSGIGKGIKNFKNSLSDSEKEKIEKKENEDK